MLVERCNKLVSIMVLPAGRTPSFRARFDAFVPFSSPFFFFSFSESAPFLSSTLPPFDFARSFRSAISSIRTCRSSCSFKRFACLPSPSCLAILAFISARSISQAFRARSWLCHSICRKRMTPIQTCQSVCCPLVPDAPSSRPIPSSRPLLRAYLAACTLSPAVHGAPLSHQARSPGRPVAGMPYQIAAQLHKE